MSIKSMETTLII